MNLLSLSDWVDEGHDLEALPILFLCCLAPLARADHLSLANLRLASGFLSKYIPSYPTVPCVCFTYALQTSLCSIPGLTRLHLLIFGRVLA